MKFLSLGILLVAIAIVFTVVVVALHEAKKARQGSDRESR